MSCCFLYFLFFFFKQKTAYEMRISDWSSDVCSSDLTLRRIHRQFYLPNDLTFGGKRINVGVYLSTPFGFALLLMLVSGLVIYPQFWRGLFRLRLRQGSAVLLQDRKSTRLNSSH